MNPQSVRKALASSAAYTSTQVHSLRPSGQGHSAPETAPRRLASPHADLTDGLRTNPDRPRLWSGFGLTRALRSQTLGLAARLLLVVCIAWVGLAQARQPRRHKASAREQKEAAALLAQGVAALAEKNTTAAQNAFEEAFRKNPAPENLFQLGKLAEAQGRLVAAQDIMRRFLQETGQEGETPEHKNAARVLALATPPNGEVNVLGARGAWVSVDDRVLGTLPLPLPLLVELGNRRIAVELGDQRIEDQAKVLPGQTVEMRFNPKTGTVVSSVSPAVIVWFDGEVSAEQQKNLTAAIGKGLAKDRQTLLPMHKALQVKPALADCLRHESCLAELAQVNEAAFVLRVQPEKSQAEKTGPAPRSYTLSVFDPAVVDSAAQSVTVCGDCVGEEAATLSVAVVSLFQQANSRSRGTVEITSKPSGAQVFLAGKKVGETPYTASRFSGEYPLQVKSLGFTPFTDTLRVQPGARTTIAATLNATDADQAEPEPFVRPPKITEPVYRIERGPRPKWRIGLGAGLCALGATVAGFGISALSVHGDPIPNTRPLRRFDTAGVGGGLLAAGLAATVGGVIAVAWPGPKQKVRVSLFSSPNTGDTGLFAW